MVRQPAKRTLALTAMMAAGLRYWGFETRHRRPVTGLHSAYAEGIPSFSPGFGSVSDLPRDS